MVSVFYICLDWIKTYYCRFLPALRALGTGYHCLFTVARIHSGGALFLKNVENKWFIFTQFFMFLG